MTRYILIFSSLLMTPSIGMSDNDNDSKINPIVVAATTSGGAVATPIISGAAAEIIFDDQTGFRDYEKSGLRKTQTRFGSRNSSGILVIEAYYNPEGARRFMFNRYKLVSQELQDLIEEQRIQGRKQGVTRAEKLELNRRIDHMRSRQIELLDTLKKTDQQLVELLGKRKHQFHYKNRGQLRTLITDFKKSQSYHKAMTTKGRARRGKQNILRGGVGGLFIGLAVSAYISSSTEAPAGAITKTTADKIKIVGDPDNIMATENDDLYNEYDSTTQDVEP